MRRTIAAVVGLLVLSAAAPAALVGPATAQGDGGGQCSFPTTATDATGTEVTVNDRPERVVTLGPSAAQTMWEIGGRSQVVGVSQFAGFLDGADERTVVTAGNRSTVQIEKVIGLTPDLVLAPNTTDPRAVQRLRAAGITVYHFGAASSIEDVYAKTRLIGRLTGNCAGASETVRSMKAQVSAVESAVEGTESPTVFYAMSGGYTAGNGTFIHELISTAGGTNLAAAAGISGYAQISSETILNRDPDYIVVSSPNPASVENPKTLLPDSSALRQTTAYRQGNVVVVNSNYVSQPAPRIVRPLTAIAEAIHPNVSVPANASANATTDANATGGGATTETSTPGFGAGVAALALLTSGLLARRRR